MSLKSLILALVFLGIGFVIGLPMGAVRVSPGHSTDQSDRLDSSDKAQRTASAHASKKQTTTPADDNSLLAKLRAIFESESNEGRISDRVESEQRVTELLNGRATSELSALASQLMHTRKSNTPAELLRAVFMHWARRDAGGAWQAALGALPEHRAEALAACLLVMSATDHLAALKRADSIIDESLRKDAKKILDDNAARVWEPAALTRRLIAMPQSERPKGLLEKTVLSWATQHLRPALDFVKSLPPSEREALLPDFCMVLALVDDEEAKRLAASIQDPKRSAEAWKRIVESYDELNPELSTALMETLPLEEMDAEFFDRRSNFSFPAEAAGRIAARLTGKSRENFLRETFANSFLVPARQLQAQLDAIELQPEDGRAIEPVVQRMMRFTPDSALAWADKLPESLLRDHVMAEASDAIGEHNRQRALQMAATVHDDKLRVKTMRSQMESWLQSNRTAAIAWLKSAEGNLMPAEERARWLRLSGVK